MIHQILSSFINFPPNHSPTYLFTELGTSQLKLVIYFWWLLLVLFFEIDYEQNFVQYAKECILISKLLLVQNTCPSLPLQTPINCITSKYIHNYLNTSLAAKGVLAHCLQRRTACKIQNGRQGAPKWRTGFGKMSTPRFLGVLSNFR